MQCPKVMDAFFREVSTLPEWQQDILVRIIKHGKQTVISQELDEIVLMIKNAFLIPLPENSPNIIPQQLDRDILPEDLDAIDDITIYGISNIQNVNALAKEGIVFRAFGASGPGLTIVYGRNGSGKTGLIRILKAISAARQKEKEEIYKNCLTEDQTPSAATIHIGNKAYVWQRDNSCVSYARKIRVFDSKNANIYLSGEVGGKTEILYTPDIFLLLDDLAQVLNILHTKLQTEKTELVNKKQSIDQKFLNQNIKNLRINKDTTDECIADLVLWNYDREVRWRKVEKSIKERAMLLNNKRALKLLLEKKLDSFQRLESLLSIKDIQELFNKINERDAYKISLEKLQCLTQKNNPLPNVCSDAWEALWQAAEGFLGATFDEHTPICPLCMQVVTGDTRARITKFHAWVSDDTKQKLNKVNKFLETKRNVFTEAEGLCRLSQDEMELLKSESAIYDKISAFLDGAKRNLFKLREKIKDKQFVQSDYLNINCEVVDMIEELNIEIKRLEQPASLEEQKEYDELQLHFICKSNLESIQELRKYDSISDKLGNVLSVCNTTKISLIKRNLNNLFLADKFNALVKSEKNILGLPYDMSFNVSTSVGRSMQELTCNDANISPSKFMSEGEAKIAALSCFIAEYKMSGAKIPLVFDDPITSLDHEYQERVIDRIVELAKETQVIVFTHHLLFAKGLRADAPNCNFIRLKTTKQVSGIVNDGEWDDKNVTEKITYIESRLQSVDADNVLSIRDLGGLIREIWEQAIEEKLFNKTVIRFDKPIHTRNLEIVRIDDSIYPLVNAGMTKTSEWANHSNALACDSKITKEMVQKELAKVKSFIEHVKRKQAKKNDAKTERFI